MDGDNDGKITPVQDVLRRINELNIPTIINPVGRLPMPAPYPVPYCYDVNGDNALTPVQDVLPIVNFLNQNPGGSPEGELTDGCPSAGIGITHVGLLSAAVSRPAVTEAGPAIPSGKRMSAIADGPTELPRVRTPADVLPASRDAYFAALEPAGIDLLSAATSDALDELAELLSGLDGR